MKTFKQFLREEKENLDTPVHRAAASIHDAWMRRNPKGDWNAHQHVAYTDLSPEEREKDVEHVRTVGSLIQSTARSSEDAGEHREAVANAFGSIQHENWRKGFDPEGAGKPRMKKVSGGGEVNINVPWSELHPEWKKENYEAGLAAYDAHTKHVVINETYRITPKRREVLNRAYREAQIGASVALNNPNAIRGMNDAMYYSAIQARIDAIRDMGLPADKRRSIMGNWGDDKSLKDSMRNSRSTQKAMLHLKKMLG
jgi:hypothetical protein